MENELELKASEFKELLQLCVTARTEGLHASVNHHCVLWFKAKNAIILQKIMKDSKGLTSY